MLSSLFQPSLVRKGARAPEFHLLNQDGHAVRLDRMLAAGPVVLLFFTDDRWPGDARWLKGYAECTGRFQERGIQLAAVSARDWEALHHFHRRHDFPFDILFDPACRLSTAYGATLISKFVTGRAAIVIDAKGTVLFSAGGPVPAAAVLEAGLR